MKPRSPTVLATGTVVIAVVCAAWLTALSCRSSSDAALQHSRQPPHTTVIVPKA